MPSAACKERMEPDHRDAVEEVRAHLVSIRGGAPFLSPADAWQLLEWLDAVMFTLRLQFFEVLVAIMHRGELGEFMVPDMLEGQGADSDAARFALAYRATCYKTLAWALKDSRPKFRKTNT